MARAKQLVIPACLLLLAAAQAGAGGALNGARSPYRLSVSDPGAYQLQPGLASRTTRLASGGLPAKPYASQIERAARKAALDPALVHAVVAVESGYDPAARSPKGALGLMQLMPQTALRYGVRDPLRSTEVNLGAGTRYLRDLLDLFDGRLDLALAAYNAGEHAVLRHGKRVPPYLETQHYVKAVSQKYRALRSGAAFAPANVEAAALRDSRLELKAR